jgi:hypothetical protein
MLRICGRREGVLTRHPLTLSTITWTHVSHVSFPYHMLFLTSYLHMFLHFRFVSPLPFMVFVIVL